MQQNTVPSLEFSLLSLAQNLVSYLPPSSNIFTESKLVSFYDNNAVSKDLKFKYFVSNFVSILNSLNPSKVAGIHNLSGKFLKGSADILARPISQLRDLSITTNSFPRSCKIAKVKPLF